MRAESDIRNQEEREKQAFSRRNTHKHTHTHTRRFYVHLLFLFFFRSLFPPLISCHRAFMFSKTTATAAPAAASASPAVPLSLLQHRFATQLNATAERMRVSGCSSSSGSSVVTAKHLHVTSNRATEQERERESFEEKKSNGDKRKSSFACHFFHRTHPVSLLSLLEANPS